jgi:hypothetical protein
MPLVVPDGLEQAWLETKDGPGLRALEPLLQGWDPEEWQSQPPAVKRAPDGHSHEQLPLFPHCSQ